MNEAGYDGIQDEGGDEDEDVQDNDEGAEDDDYDDYNQNDDNDDEDGDDDNDVDDDDDDDDEDEEDEDEEAAAEGEEGGLMSTQSAREYIFPILLSELVKEKVLSEDDGDILKELFSGGDAVVNAALDVYDLDSDMAELVDTLQKVARSQ